MSRGGWHKAIEQKVSQVIPNYNSHANMRTYLINLFTFLYFDLKLHKEFFFKKKRARYVERKKRNN